MSSSPWNYDRSHDGPAGLIPDQKGYFHQNKLASAPWRWAAGFIDWGIIFFGSFFIIYNVVGGDQIAYFVSLALAFFNSGFLAAKTTQSLGKRICGIQMVWVKVDQNQDAYVCYVPVWVGLLRVFLHYPLDWIPLAIGFWLIPVVSKSRCTISDFACRTVNYRDPRLPRPINLSGPQYRRDWV